MKVFSFLILILIICSCKLGGPIFSTNENDVYNQAHQYDSYAYDKKYEVVEGLRRVERDGLFGFHDRKGNLVIPVIYTDARDFSNGLTAVKKEDHYGYIDKKGDRMIDLMYSLAGDFKDGEAKVNFEGFDYYINKENQCVRECPDQVTREKYRIEIKE